MSKTFFGRLALAVSMAALAGGALAADATRGPADYFGLPNPNAGRAVTRDESASAVTGGRADYLGLRNPNAGRTQANMNKNRARSTRTDYFGLPNPHEDDADTRTAVDTRPSDDNTGRR